MYTQASALFRLVRSVRVAPRAARSFSFTVYVWRRLGASVLGGAWRLTPLSPLPPFSVVRAALRLGAVLRAYVLCAPPPRLALFGVNASFVRSLRVVRPRARRRRSRSPRASVPPCVVAQGSARVGAFSYGLAVASARARYAAASRPWRPPRCGGAAWFPSRSPRQSRGSAASSLRRGRYNGG